HFARKYVRKALAESLSEELESVYRANSSPEPFSASASAMAKRSLKNTVLSYLIILDTDDSLHMAQKQLDAATNMTDELAALSAIINSDHASESLRDQVLEGFYQRWSDEALVVNQWLTAQSHVSREGGLERVQALMTHDAFDIKNPNKIRAVIGAFCGGNSINFHRADGAGYEFLADQILTLNKLNPQIASRLLTPLTKWRKYDVSRQKLMRAALDRILSEPELSKDVYEVVSKSLKD
ncbi:aminopeptidase N C-terminal domain-containing protein, partial [Pseudomaricurvus sp.]|uniref:aminopeptidase N C-terminal domain-containing protein n=1 Tax=Pseudomaricurvus sp. TaxID=2004510 RepID=UPI003F6BA0F0